MQLSKAEMVAQMATLTIAGHETTANTLTWLLWELAKQPKYQDQLRDEIKHKREEVVDRDGEGSDFRMEDLESMPFLQALLKVSKRQFACPSVDTNLQLRKFLDSTQSYII